MNKRMKIIGILAAATIALGLTGCGATENQARKELQSTYSTANSLEVANLKEKLAREDDPDSIRYLYVMSFGQVVGYYVTKGKISSSGSQLAPEQEIIYGGGNGNVVDSAQDDGSYGSGDPGIFFFTTEGVMVVTDLDYIQSDAPLPIDVPRLGGKD
jgi:hypothetical protein